MSPLASSESVDAFLTWLATPTNALAPDHGHVHGHGHAHVHGHHGHGHGHTHGHTHGVGFVPQKGKVSDKEREYAACLMELARSPLEEMAKPLLVGAPVVTTRAPSSNSGSENGSGRMNGKEKKEKRKDGSHSNSSSGGGSAKSASASPPNLNEAVAVAAKMKSGPHVKGNSQY